MLIDVPKKDLGLMLESGYIYLAMGKFKEAKKVFEGLVNLEVKHEVPRVGLANVYFAQEKFLPAIRQLKEAIKINPESPFAHAHLGEAYLFYGKKDLAIEMLNKAKELDQDGSAKHFSDSLLDLIEKGFDPVELKKSAKQEKTNKKK
jgi:tetratricopeptide (TPR) repeat protein